MSTAPVKTKNLHNFSLPCLKWAHKNSTSRHRTRPHNPSSQPETDPNTPTQNHPQQALDEPQDSSAKPWNLRPRKSALAQTTAFEPPAVESHDCGAQKSERRDKKTKLWIPLSREEIEEDLFSMSGSKPARRPKKRTKTVQKHVDDILPGLYLAGASVDSYRTQFL
ncbi:hypothetical protein POM88_032551 [Heracleum sosnowskyi]|uniref:Uncharacterized protein n=1 Tax=Heracleum sosnowskyi TaxID=360622 RepID=A0AAD8I0D7_9APIA|nr:hypothetical protein POM88_032551 [Heracleum sosnowskyi]